MDDGTIRRGAGGTPGGILEFIIGLALVVGGGFLFINQVTVTSRGFMLFFPWAGGFEISSFGIAMLPLLFGIGMLFFNGRNLFGWFLLVSGAIIILLGIITNLDIYFRPTSLFSTLFMLGMVMAGLGLIARALRPH